jgi:hypothetical protein
MLAARLDTVRQAYKNGTGRPQDFTFITKKSLEALDDLGLNGEALDPMLGNPDAVDLASRYTDLGGEKSGEAASGDAPAEQPKSDEPPPVTDTVRPWTVDELSRAATPQTQEDYDALPQGALYIDPDDQQPHWKL